MPTDAQGNLLTTTSEDAARAFDHTVEGYLGFRADTAQRLATLLATHPDLGMAHLIKGYLSMLPCDAGFVPRARQALADAQEHLARATPRERAHAQALAHWIDGDIDPALTVWEQILADNPRDVLAFRLHHFAAFWCGRPEQMLAAVQRVLPHWSASVPSWGAALACSAFANEECGNYAAAEASGQQAIALDPGNLWATHALAHVMEMQRRADDGIVFLDQMERHWAGGNAIKHHLWWHRAMYHLERREFDAVLDL